MTEPHPTYTAGQTFGRPRLADEPLQVIAVRLTADQVAWLDQQPGTRTQVIRHIIEWATAIPSE